MNKHYILLAVLVYSLGCTSGYFFSKKKFREFADKEVESVKRSLKNYYSQKIPEKDIPKKVTEVKSKKPKKNEKFKEKSEKDYHDYSAMYREPKSEVITKSKEEIISEANNSVMPLYIITEEEFNESEYEAQSLTYFSDGVLTDDDYNMIQNPEDLIGPEAVRELIDNLSNNTDYRLDTLYVQNDNIKVCYEILIDERSYPNRYTSQHGVVDNEEDSDN